MGIPYSGVIWVIKLLTILLGGINGEWNQVKSSRIFSLGFVSSESLYMLLWAHWGFGDNICFLHVVSMYAILFVVYTHIWYVEYWKNCLWTLKCWLFYMPLITSIIVHFWFCILGNKIMLMKQPFPWNSGFQAHYHYG